MAKLGTDFSEAGYAFVFLENLLHGPHLHRGGAPTFVTPYAEGMGLHYDVFLPTAPVAFFFQFKIPEVLQKGARLTSGSSLKVPFYRMNLRHENAYAQHHGLTVLESTGANVYYLAPRFHTQADMDIHFARDLVPDFSAWFRPALVTPPNYRGPHGVVYDRDGSRSEVRSKGGPTREGEIDFESFLTRWNAACQGAKVTPLDQFAAKLGAQVDRAIAAMERAAQESESPAAASETRTEKDPDDEAQNQRIARSKAREFAPLARVAMRARSALGLQMLLGLVQRS